MSTTRRFTQSDACTRFLCCAPPRISSLIDTAVPALRDFNSWSERQQLRYCMTRLMCSCPRMIPITYTMLVCIVYTRLCLPPPGRASASLTKAVIPPSTARGGVVPPFSSRDCEGDDFRNHERNGKRRAVAVWMIWYNSGAFRTANFG